MHEFRKVFEYSACTFVKDEYPERLQRRKRSSGLTKLTTREDCWHIEQYPKFVILI